MGPVWAVVVAAGSGRRFGGAKQYADLGGRIVVARSVDTARAACDGVVLVVPPGDEQLPAVAALGADLVVAGGTTRSASVRAGLAGVPAAAEVIVVHDAARPLAHKALFDAAIEAVRRGADGAICGVEVTDTIKRVDGTRVVETLPREVLIATQTPQAFSARVLRAAHAGMPEATDDAAVVEAAGGKVVVVPGDPANIKLTTAADLHAAELLL